MSSIPNTTDAVISLAVALVSGPFKPLVKAAILGNNKDLETLLSALPDKSVCSALYTKP